jgi:hypothetical protein
LPDHTGIGAVPLKRAKACRERNRVAPAVSQDGRRSQHPAARDRDQPWRQHPHQVAQITLELVDPHGQLPAAAQQLPGDLGDRAVHAGQVGSQLVDHLVAAQPA